MLTTLFDEVAQDIRYAIRGLRRSPGFTIVVVLTLGFGIGANTAMFSVVDELMFRPYPYLKDPGTVHRVYGRRLNRGTLTTRPDAEYTSYLDVQRWTTSFSQYVGFSHRRMAVGAGDASRERTIAVVSASFFDFFDVRPAVGRFFVREEDTTPRGADVVVLGYDFWKVEMGGRDVVGEVLDVGNIRATIIGVAPKSFVGVSDAEPPAAFLPITTFAGAQPYGRDAATYYTAYYWRWMEIMVRRKPGVTVEQASADLSRAAVRSWNARRTLEPALESAEIARPGAVASSLKVGAGPDPSLEARTALWVSGVAGIVLLIACSNVANLFLLRASGRTKQLAVRLALGMSRRRLIMQSLTESLLLSVGGCIVALAMTQWGGAGIRALLNAMQSVPLDVFTDWRTLTFSIGLALGVGVFTGLAPALLGRQRDVAGALKAGGRTGTRSRSPVRTTLLLVQGALSVILLVGAALFVSSLRNVSGMRLGYDADQVILASHNSRGVRLADSARVRLRRDLLAAAQTIPSVERATWVMTIPLRHTNSTGLFVPGIASVGQLGSFTYQAATTDYFRVMGTRILRGRSFTADDRAGTPPIAVVSEGMAKALWPNRDAIGQCMHVFADTMPCTTVVGIAEDIVQQELTSRQRYHFYMPIEQFAPAGGEYMLLRMRGDPATQTEAVRKILQQALPGRSYVTVRPLSDVVIGARRSWQLGAAMFVAFGALALVVAAVGMYGVIAFDVRQRAHELAVRVALGAQPANILRLVVSQAVSFALVASALGLTLAFAAGRWLEPLLFQQSATDPIIYGAVCGVLLIVALGASASPAARAARSDPNAALKAE